MACILLVEDNQLITEAVSGYLQVEGYQTITFGKVAGVMDAVKRGTIDLAILDIMLPDGNGFVLAKEIRKISSMPLIFLTAKDSESDRILGFEIGADDYVCKPFSTKELVLRVQALLKRTGTQSTHDAGKTKSWTADNEKIGIDSEKHLLTVNGKEVNLTSAEWKILLYLCGYENQVVSREKLLSECLNYNFEGSERTIDTHIANLRTKLGKGNWIVTVRGFGYRFSGNTPQ
jgi:two-component system phosphate regulon response regulator PhoB